MANYTMSSMKVELLREPYGDDLMVVNAARVSFDKESEWDVQTFHPDDPQCWGTPGEIRLSEADTRLIQFLARGMTTDDFDEFVRDAAALGGVWASVHSAGWGEAFIGLLWEWRRNPTHWAPFAHPHASFRIKAPIFVARQLAKHQIGMTWSEVSRRYIDEEPEFYVPEVWRKRAENVKQGSSDEAIDENDYYGTCYESFICNALNAYKRLLEQGVCPEQARMALPQSTMTEWIWTGSLYAWANVYNQRTNSHAQRETQEIARQIGDHLEPYFPVSWKALTCSAP